MEIEIKNEGTNSTFLLSGVIDIPGANTFKVEMAKIEHLKPKKVILDFSNVTFIGSSGIAVILIYYKRVHVWGGTMELINVNSEIQALFRSIRLNALFEL